MISGVYAIVNKLNNKFYIGSSYYIKKRQGVHFRDLAKGVHHSVKLQRAYNKYGKDSFEFIIIEECPTEHLLELEQWFLDNYKPFYNTSLFANAPAKDRVISNETREKLSKANMGNKRSLGYKHTEESRKKMSENSPRRLMSESNKQKLIEANSKRKGEKRRPHSKETKQKMSENNHNVSKVDQLNLEGAFIKTWDSIANIVRELKFQQASISRCCLGSQKTAYGFKWKYTDKK